MYHHLVSHKLLISTSTRNKAIPPNLRNKVTHLRLSGSSDQTLLVPRSTQISTHLGQLIILVFFSCPYAISMCAVVSDIEPSRACGRRELICYIIIYVLSPFKFLNVHLVCFLF